MKRLKERTGSGKKKKRGNKKKKNDGLSYFIQVLKHSVRFRHQEYGCGGSHSGSMTINL